MNISIRDLGDKFILKCSCQHDTSFRNDINEFSKYHPPSVFKCSKCLKGVKIIKQNGILEIFGELSFGDSTSTNSFNPATTNIYNSRTNYHTTRYTKSKKAKAKAKAKFI